MKVKILRYKPTGKDSPHKGFCEILYEGIMQIRDCAHFQKDDQEWINLPTKSFQNKEGNTKYYSVNKFPDKDKYWDFQDACKAALASYFDGHAESAEGAVDGAEGTPF